MESASQPVSQAPTSPSLPPATAATRVVIEPPQRWQVLNLREIWEYRELLWALAMRDIAVRYKQTALGVLWVVLQPLVMMAIFTVIFQRMVQGTLEQSPYAAFALAGLLPWQMFARAMGESSTSLAVNQNLITKVYFPRILLPLTPILSSLVDFVIALGLSLGLMAWYGIWPTWRLAMLPVFLLLAVLTSLAVGVWLSALNAVYRDVRYVIPFLTQVWFFLSPVVYPPQLVSEQYRLLYQMNPMVGVIQGFRWSLLGQAAPPWGMVAISTAVMIVLLVTGLYNFKRMEAGLADVV